MRQPGWTDNISDGVDSIHIGSVGAIDHDTVSIHRHTHGFQPEVFHVANDTCGDEDPIRLERFLFPFGVLNGAFTPSPDVSTD